ncbi:MAG: hypothetical protein EOP11_06340 [Proteobacteria bacterium]|nr:MAG: hypothetical protein EOP11_06340 [Pseudomonadota bacterium]
MPSTLIACLLFILTHSVVAQADFSPAGESPFSLAKWQITHSGQAPLGAQIHTASLEVSDAPVLAFASIERPVHRAYRLTLRGAGAQMIVASYELHPELLSGEDAFLEGLSSREQINHELCFRLIPLDGGAYRVRATSRSDGAPVGDFLLEQAP